MATLLLKWSRKRFEVVLTVTTKQRIYLPGLSFSGQIFLEVNDNRVRHVERYGHIEVALRHPSTAVAGTMFSAKGSKP